ncbi:MAG: phosphonate metabolism protein [Paracoccus denitrificans]|nr:MAG: phosphonate metabolism protein [Paracoccus denitrificans]PZO85119.1 MAG: phosphonate metabolism protein [Paracoccus denitrificans]
MTEMKRFAVYYAPPAGDFADRANRWLGRDPVSGQALVPPDLGLDAAAITTEPRRYGFHGTIKPPFRLAPGVTPNDVKGAVAALAARLAPVTVLGLRIATLDGFLALIPDGDAGPLLDLAGTVVRDLDPLRAPLTDAEVARRRPDRLSARQRDLLDQWGYPFVFEEFRFHLTLTDRLPADQAAQAQRVLGDYFAPVLPRPFVVGDLCLFGEPQDGGPFRLIHRYALTG